MTTGKTIALTRWTFVDKVMSLCFNVLSKFSELVIYIYISVYLYVTNSLCCIPETNSAIVGDQLYL